MKSKLKKRKLLLICPSSKVTDYNLQLVIPPLGLGYIAALTPDDWEISIVDERVDILDTNAHADLVGITSITTNVSRAYALSEMFRKRKIPVILGGIHVSMLPEEALKYADSVLIGEAEPIWNEVINDFCMGTLKRTYIGDKLPLDNIPQPRRDLFSNKYEVGTIQTSRGCPFSCDFCSVSAFYGKRYRQRPLVSVLDELETIPYDRVVFIDDNIFGSSKISRERALSLFKGIIDRKINKLWATLSSINISDDDEILDYAFRSGCRVLYIGFESLDEVILHNMNKEINLEVGSNSYIQKIRRIHNHGIAVVGSFIVGADHDDIGVFDRLLKFLNQSGIDTFDLNYPTPFPGTELYKRMLNENRIIYNNYPSDWDYYNTSRLVIKHDKMNISDIINGYNYIRREWSKPLNRLLHFFRTFINTKSITCSLLMWNMNSSIKCDDYYNYLKHRL